MHIMQKKHFAGLLQKTISYRVAILILEFGSIYLFTGQIKVALGFMIVSNIYTTVGFFSRENLG